MNFTPDFVYVARKPTIDEYNRVNHYNIVGCNGNSDVFSDFPFIPNLNARRVNDTPSTVNRADNLTIIENGFQIKDWGFGAPNVVWIAVKFE